MAADVSARVHLVAEKLQQKAQDAQRKGNEGAARAMAESVGDLRAAVALIAEQRHLLTRRRGEGVDEDERDEQLAETQALAARLARVQAMLAKKAEEQRVKGNEGAAGALQGASASVGKGRGVILAQQQQIFGLLGRWERLEDVLSGRKRSVVASDDGESQQETENEDESAQGRLIASVQELMQLRMVLETEFPGCRGAEEVAKALADAKQTSGRDDAALDEARAQCKQLQSELDSAKRELDETRREAQETSEMLWQQVATLEDAKHELEEQREQQTARFSAAEEEHAALEQQQREAQRALETLVRESDAELQRLRDKSTEDAEELHLLRSDMDTMTQESSRLRAEHAEEVLKLREQLESSTAAIAAMENSQELVEEKADAKTTEQETEQTEDEDEEKPGVDAGPEEADADEETGDEDVDVPLLEEDSLETTGFASEDEVSGDSGVKEGSEDGETPGSEAQTPLTELQARVAEQAKLSQAQQDAIAVLERERNGLQKQIEALTASKTEAVDELRRHYEEEAAQRVAESEAATASLSAQLDESRERVKVATQENQEAIAKLEVELKRCEDELSSCRLELKAEKEKSSKLTTDLQAAQQTEQQQREAMNTRLSLAEQLEDLSRLLGGGDESTTSVAVVEKIKQRAWESPEVSALCKNFTTSLEALLTVQQELKTAEQQLSVLQLENDEQSAAVAGFLESCGGRLLEKHEDVQTTVGVAESSPTRASQLATASLNVSKWLEQLEQLQKKTEEDAAKITGLEDEKHRSQERVKSLESELEATVKTLQAQVTALEREKMELATATEHLKAENHSVSQQEQAARQEEVATLEQQLIAVRSEFERYRSRSHTALKKMEKRAELLNGMRKENESLLKQVMASDEARQQAEMARRAAETKVDEVTQAREMMQAEFEKYATDKSRAMGELEATIQQLSVEREDLEKQITQLKAQLLTLESEKVEVEEQGRRSQAAERAALEARLQDSSVAAQEAKQAARKAQDALAASKAEIEKQQQLVESLEMKLQQLEQQQIESPSAGSSSAPASVSSASVSIPTAPLSARSDTRRSSEAETELAALRTSEASLRQAVDVARADLVALQERFATTKAANAEKVFALEEQSHHWELQLSAAKEEIGQLSAALEKAKQTKLQSSQPPSVQPSQELETAKPTETQVNGAEKLLRGELEAKTTEIRKLRAQVHELETELKDASTEITLLTRSLDACRDELQETPQRSEVLDATKLTAENATSGTVSSAQDAATAVAKEKELKALRVEVLELKEELHVAQEEKAAREAEREKQELEELRSGRQQMQVEKERAMKLLQRQTLVADFQKHVSAIVEELQERLEDHSSAFRDACDFRDEHRSVLLDEYTSTSTGAEADDDTQSGNARKSGDTAYEECLVMRSGAVIKAGATFRLPVICEKRGWRVKWNFSVKEDAADVAFRLLAQTASGETEILEPERLSALSGVFQVTEDATTLVFEWDNSFSWLNEKTLDYHVSIQEQLSPGQQRTRRSERELQRKATLLRDALAFIQEEQRRRAALSDTLDKVRECETTKRKHVELLSAQEEVLRAQKARFQEEMEAQKAAFSAVLREQDELEDTVNALERAWATAEAEREDVEMTLKLAGNGSVLESLGQQLEEQAIAVQQQLQDQQREGEDVDMTQEEEMEADLAKVAEENEPTKQETQTELTVDGEPEADSALSTEEATTEVKS